MYLNIEKHNGVPHLKIQSAAIRFSPCGTEIKIACSHTVCYSIILEGELRSHGRGSFLGG